MQRNALGTQVCRAERHEMLDARGVLTMLVVTLALLLAMLPAGKAGAFGRDSEPNTAGLRAWLLTTDGRLMRVDLADPGSVGSVVSVRGMMAGEQLVGIDIRPATGELYGVSDDSRVYVINPQSGAARAVGAPFAAELEGDAFGVDFNPTVDLIRIVSDRGENLRVSPVSGQLVAVDTDLAYAIGDRGWSRAPWIVAAAYSESRIGATSTVLYDIDAGRDTLVTQTPANSGALQTVGDLGVDVDGLTGFDIAPLRRAWNGSTNLGLAVFNEGGSSALYSIDLASGRATRQGTLAGGQALDIAVYAPWAMGNAGN